MLIIFIINKYYNVNRFLKCVILNMYVYIMLVIHIIHKFVIKFWLHMQLMGHGGLSMDEYTIIEVMYNLLT